MEPTDKKEKLNLSDVVSEKLEEIGKGLDPLDALNETIQIPTGQGSFVGIEIKDPKAILVREKSGGLENYSQYLQVIIPSDKVLEGIFNMHEEILSKYASIRNEKGKDTDGKEVYKLHIPIDSIDPSKRGLNNIYQKLRDDGNIKEISESL